MEAGEDFNKTQEVLGHEAPRVSYKYSFYVHVVPDEGQVIVERVGTLVVVTKGALEAMKELISTQFPDSQIIYDLPKNLLRQAERILSKARKKREWQKDYFKTVVPPLYSPGVGLAKSDSSMNQQESHLEVEGSQTSDTTTQTDS